MTQPRAESERVIDLYERHARAWDCDRQRSLAVAVERAWLDRFISLLPDGAGILDLGCGSGQPIARYLVESGLTVAGVDSSPTMISLCRARLPQQRWRVGDMRRLALAERWQGLVAWDSFFHLAPESQRSMFPIFRAHLSTPGALLFTSGPSAGEVMGTYRGDPLYHASLAEAEYRTLLSESGFEVVQHAAEDPTCGGRTVWLARLAPAPSS